MKKCYADGGMPMVNKGGKMVPSFAADGKGKMAKGGMAHSDAKMDKSIVKKAVSKHAAMPASKAHAGLKAGGMAKGYAKGGGIEVKGKTKGTMIAMKSGGRTC